jgi:hypothetical protein
MFCCDGLRPLNTDFATGRKLDLNQKLQAADIKLLLNPADIMCIRDDEIQLPADRCSIVTGNYLKADLVIATSPTGK